LFGIADPHSAGDKHLNNNNVWFFFSLANITLLKIMYSVQTEYATKILETMKNNNY
jgi:hypothetical protein